MPSIPIDFDSLGFKDILNSIFSDEERKDVLEQFKLATSNKCRISIMLKAAGKYGLIPAFSSAKSKVKNQIDSEKFKNDGNKIFLLKRDAEEYLKALELYNKSIAFAPSNSTQLSLGFANRSAVLYHLRKYSEAVQDIDRALELNYPVNLKHKLLIRKAECLALLGSAELNAVYEESLKWINDMSVDASNKEILKNKLTAAREVSKEEKQDDFDPDLPIIVSQNEIPVATNAVALKYNKKFGRHLVATREIKAGEVLAVEKPYAIALKTVNLYTHCSHCLKFAWASIPCENCVHVLYCSKNCKVLAWKEYHEIECPVTGAFLDLQFCKANFLCMRLTILAVREFGGIEKLKEELIKIDSCKADPRTKGFSEDGKLHSNTYRSIYNLITNQDKRHIFQLFLMTYNSVLILYYMATCSAFFGETFKNNDFTSLLENDNVVFIGELILRHFQIIACNAYQFQERRISGYKDCGTSIVPFLSFLNHSCNANTCRTLLKGHFVLYALCPIKKDAQLFDNYGKTYWNVAKEERQSKLAGQYLFTCKCDPCQQNWPLLSKLTPFELQMNSIKSYSDRIKLQTLVNLHLDYNDLLMDAKTLTDKCKIVKSNPNMIKDSGKIVQVFMKYYPLNSLQFFNAVNTLKVVINAFGNRFEVPELKQL